ncbi:MULTISPECIES: hypothetical protein [Moorena]|uniref:Uncharacterized protein n=1 Tax=Moorena producens 3L TaxID=489825 RepID=F4XN80_9CYAN|nr:MULTISPECIES: hypothetical protein [Moorena]EGJ34139.1 hypothetical protein LYNGBM3L_23550 [Moorena producens 3L]NEP69552.1 hypothetical protein [Moorena sp. SIO3A5]NEQ05194.1 hypothetical protein [Moorena sp. SIO4E2]
MPIPQEDADSTDATIYLNWQDANSTGRCRFLRCDNNHETGKMPIPQEDADSSDATIIMKLARCQFHSKMPIPQMRPVRAPRRLCRKMRPNGDLLALGGARLSANLIIRSLKRT